MQIRVFRPSELSTSHRDAWRHMQATVDAYRSPYFHPEFTAAVAAVRDDVHVAVLSLGSEVVGFFPFQRGPRAAGRAIGGRLSDFHGVIARPGVPVDLDHLLAACRLKSFAFDHLILPHQPFSPAEWKTAASPYLDLRAGYEGFRRDRIAAGSEDSKQVERKTRKLEREHSALTFEMHTTDESAWAALLEWKSQQYRETGKSDVFSYPWTVQLIRRLAEKPTSEFGGVLSTVRAGSQLVAVHYGLRCRHVLHYWFPAYDRSFSRYSPGNILLCRIAQEAGNHGIDRIDLGKGDEQQKVNFSNQAEMVAEGFVDQRSMSRLARVAWNGARAWVKASPWLSAVAEGPLRWLRPLRERRSFQ